MPVIYINDAPQFLKEGSSFRRYLQETRSPFAILREARIRPRYLRDYAKTRPALAPLIDQPAATSLPQSWNPPKVAGRDFVMPWNITKEFWSLYDKPADQRPLYPFHAEPIDEFVKTYSGKREVPIFDSKFVVPVIYINDAAELLKEGSSFRRYLQETRSPFAILINYGAANFASDADAQAAWSLLNGELRDQFLGWVSGESIGYVWDDAPTASEADA